VHICNLVQEFNGLVSKGPVAILALLLFILNVKGIHFSSPLCKIFHSIYSHIVAHLLIFLISWCLQ